MSGIVRRENRLLDRLDRMGIDALATYAELTHKARHRGTFLDFDAYYDDLSTRVIEVEVGAPREQVQAGEFLLPEVEVLDLLLSYRLMYASVDRPPGPKGGGFSCWR